MTAIYRIPLETELACLKNRLGVDDGEMLPGLVRACYVLAQMLQPTGVTPVV